MDYQCIEELLDLPEFRVKSQLILLAQVIFHLERRASTLICPHCQTSCHRIKESRSRTLRDLPILERPVQLVVNVRRFDCHCCERRPWESIESLGKRAKWTNRLYHRVRDEFLQGCPSRELARRYGVPARTVFRWTFERSRGGRPRKLSRAIGIDEYARRKGHNYNTIIVDLERRQPIATFKGRRAEDVVPWFQRRSQEELDRVETVVLDMSKSFYSSVNTIFGDHVQVIDRFHVIQSAVNALSEVIRSVQKQLPKDESKALGKLRKKGLRSANQLDVDDLIARADWRRRFPGLREAIDWVQDLRGWFDRKYEKPARAALSDLIERASQSSLKALNEVAGTLTRWFEPIVRYIRNRYTNGPTEGFNNKIKLIQRMAYGLRNEHNRKKRIMASCGKT